MVIYRVILLLALAALSMTSTTLAATAKKPPAQQAQPREERPAPITVLSIIPAQGEPGMMVILNGSGFTDKTIAFLGGNEVPTTVTDAKQLSFDIPELPPGLYALFLKREDGYTSKPYNFTLMPQKPVALSLAPDTIYSCASGKDREVLLHGKNFQNGAQVLFNGAAIGSRFISPETLAFLAPQVNGGLHQVQVKNPAETTSGTLALFIDSKPEIQSVAQGEEFVNYYELIIEGRNFQQGSTVVVDGARLPVGTANIGEREKVVYGGCTRLVYQRHPYDNSPKSFRLQILNPNGEESQAVSVNAP
jgi:hypothetical protein